MKTLNYLKTVFSVSLLAGMMIYGSAFAQEYDDMYFNKTDRKTVKVKKSDLKAKNEAIKENYKEIVSSTENVSSKNINPEYIARYKNIEPENNAEEEAKSDDYNGDDYYVENYDAKEIKKGSGMVSSEEYLNSKKYDREYTSQTKTNSAMSGFHPSFSVGMGFGYSPYGYGYPGMGYGMSYSMSMSWGMGGGFYDPWMYDPWMYNPTMSFYDQYMMSRYYRPWRYPFYGGYPYGGYYPYGGFSPYGGLSASFGYGMPMGMGLSLGFGVSYYGGGNYGTPYYPYYPGAGGEYSNVKYQPRTSSRSTTSRIHIPRETAPRTSVANTRNLRIPDRNTATQTSTGSNARIARDYSKTENEYYNNSRIKNSSSSQRISSSSANRYNYRAPSTTRSGRTGSRGTSSYSTINNNRPVRGSSGYSSGNSRYYDSGSRSSYNSRTGRSSSGSTYTPSRSYAPSRSFGSSGSSSYSSGSSSFSGSSGRSTGGASRSRH